MGGMSATLGWYKDSQPKSKIALKEGPRRIAGSACFLEGSLTVTLAPIYRGKGL